MKVFILIGLLAVLIISVFAGVSANAADNAENGVITKTFSMESLIDQMEMKGFEVTVEGDTVTAYGEYPEKTFTMTFECPDGECTKTWSKDGYAHKQSFGMKKHSWFGMGDGAKDPEAFHARLESMDMTQEDIDAMKAKFAEFGHNGCSFAKTAE